MFRIKINHHYYSGTFGTPPDGYIRHPSDTVGKPVEFDSVVAAYDYLTRTDGPDALFWYAYYGNGEFAPAGTYVCHHGQYARPVARVVNARGKTTKAIVAECDRVAKVRGNA